MRVLVMVVHRLPFHRLGRDEIIGRKKRTQFFGRITDRIEKILADLFRRIINFIRVFENKKAAVMH